MWEQARGQAEALIGVRGEREVDAVGGIEVLGRGEVEGVGGVGGRMGLPEVGERERGVVPDVSGQARGGEREQGGLGAPAGVEGRSARGLQGAQAELEVGVGGVARLERGALGERLVEA